MICTKCGTTTPDGAGFCSNCGFAIEVEKVVIDRELLIIPVACKVTFSEAIEICLSNFFNFNGRASRTEYWWFYLFTVLLSWGAAIVDKSGTLAFIVSLIFCFPVFAAGARRLHDTNHSGWLQLLYLTVIGIIPVVVWLASSGTNRVNQYGNPSSESRH
ncbi:MAG: DUF805 domain-containing protein [Pseudomonadota bacterium]|nr:DUF805 domain-containing protein [Pseudomonadota bacterium]